MENQSQSYIPEGLNGLCQILEQCLSKEILPNFINFINQFSVAKWLIVSDYCLAKDGNVNAVMVFTIIPGDRYLIKPEEIRRALPKDLKDVSTITDEAVEFLKDPRLFSFAFAIDPKTAFLRNLKEARRVIDEALQMMKAWPNANLPHIQDLIKKQSLLKEKAKANAFKVQLFSRAVLCSAIAGFIGTLIAKHCTAGADKIIWIPDRDDMHSTWKGITNDLFHTNLHAFALDQKLAGFKDVCITPHNKGDEWDDYIRIPDYFAGPITFISVDRDDYKITARSPKYFPLIQNVFAENSNLAIVVLSFWTSKQWCRIINIKKGQPPSPNQSH